MKIDLDITEGELERLLAALRLCTASGGGSTNWSLFMKLTGQARAQGFEPEIEKYFVDFSEVMITDAEEAGVIQRIA